MTNLNLIKFSKYKYKLWVIIYKKVVVFLAVTLQPSRTALIVVVVK